MSEVHENKLKIMFNNLHADIESRLSISRESFEHSTIKGTATENVWLGLLREYLPSRYQVDSGQIVDYEGRFSKQIDIIVHDRFHSPLIFKLEGQTIIPVESVYAVLEVKQEIDAEIMADVAMKVQSVLNLKPTNLSVAGLGGTELFDIIGGVLALDSKWQHPLGAYFKRSLREGIEIGCIASHGYFIVKNHDDCEVTISKKATTEFLFKFISMLQSKGNVPIIDLDKYTEKNIVRDELNITTIEPFNNNVFNTETDATNWIKKNINKFEWVDYSILKNSSCDFRIVKKIY